MSTDKRSVHTDALDTLGSIIDDKQARDAIHLAVEPVIAGETLMPGEHVGLFDTQAWKKGTFYHNFEGGPKVPVELLGIVDPFLAAPVKAGERFWLVVYPRQITSLRHVWTHPAFPDAEIGGFDHETKSESEAWLRNFAENKAGSGYFELMNRIEEYCKYGEEESDGTLYASFDVYGEIPSEFWSHFKTVTGLEPKGKAPDHFVCGC